MFNRLPKDIKLQIASYLTTQDAVALLKISKEYNKLFSEASFWRKRMQIDFRCEIPPGTNAKEAYLIEWEKSLQSISNLPMCTVGLNRRGKLFYNREIDLSDDEHDKKRFSSIAQFAKTNKLRGIKGSANEVYLWTRDSVYILGTNREYWLGISDRTYSTDELICIYRAKKNDEIMNVCNTSRYLAVQTKKEICILGDPKGKIEPPPYMSIIPTAKEIFTSVTQKFFGTLFKSKTDPMIFDAPQDIIDMKETGIGELMLVCKDNTLLFLYQRYDGSKHPFTNGVTKELNIDVVRTSKWREQKVTDFIDKKVIGYRTGKFGGLVVWCEDGIYYKPETDYTNLDKGKNTPNFVKAKFFTDKHIRNVSINCNNGIESVVFVLCDEGLFASQSHLYDENAEFIPVNINHNLISNIYQDHFLYDGIWYQDVTDHGPHWYDGKLTLTLQPLTFVPIDAETHKLEEIANRPRV